MTLRSSLIRLAAHHPEVRSILLPLLGKQARDVTFEEAVKGKTFTNPETGNKVKFQSLPDKAQSEIRQRWKSKEQKSEEATPESKSKLPAVPKAILGVFSKSEQNLPQNAVQKSANIDEMYKEADKAHGHQLDLLNQGKGLDKALGAKVIRADQGARLDIDQPGPIVIIGPQKKRERVKEKAKADGKDVNSVLDIVRSTVALDTADDVPKAMAALRKLGMKIARKPKNRFAEPTDVGYRDLMFNVEYPNGHIGEVQINLKSMIKAKEKGHKFYEKSRSLEAKKKEDGRLTPEEDAELAEANAAQRKLYDAAWKEAMGGKTESAPKGKQAAEEKDRYYEWNDKPAVKRPLYFPKYMDFEGKEKVVPSVEVFYREAVAITKAQYDKMVKEIKDKKAPKDKGDKDKKNLRASLIRLAHANPELRADLLPLLTAKQAKKQTTEVKQPKDKATKGKADPQRDPYAKSLAQGQFQPKVTNPDKRQKIRDKFKD